MEKEIKNFDRSIEQIMNENSVTPPFGMWNRISAELESEALPIAAAAPLARVPKRAMFSFIAGVAVIGLSLVTAYLINNKTTQTVNTTLPVSSGTGTSLSFTKVDYSKLSNVVSEKENQVQRKKKIAFEQKTAVKTSAAQNEIANDNSTKNYNDVPVPNQLLSSKVTEQTDYYFPPVDIVNAPPVEAHDEIATISINQLAKLEEKIDDKKGKISVSSSSEKRVKLKKHRRSGFTYGSLNRLSKHRTN